LPILLKIREKFDLDEGVKPSDSTWLPQDPSLSGNSDLLQPEPEAPSTSGRQISISDLSLDFHADTYYLNTENGDIELRDGDQLCLSEKIVFDVIILDTHGNQKSSMANLYSDAFFNNDELLYNSDSRLESSSAFLFGERPKVNELFDFSSKKISNQKKGRDNDKSVSDAKSIVNKSSVLDILGINEWNDSYEGVVRKKTDVMSVFEETSEAVTDE